MNINKQAQETDITTLVLLSVIMLTPALLLTTNNFSVASVVLLVIYSIYNLVQKPWVRLNNFDKLVVACMCAYFIGAIPVAMVDGSTARYFQGGVRLLFCVPIYLFLRTYKKPHLDKYIQSLTIGVIIGCFGSLIIAIYQYFILGMERVDGFLFSINFGYLACALTFLAICLTQFGWLRIWLNAAAFASVIATLLTFTRGAIFAIPLLFILIAVLNFRKLSGLKIIVVTSCLFFGASISYLTSHNMQERIDFTIQELTAIAHGNVDQSISSGGRLQLWKAASYAFASAPLTGLPYEQREALNRELHAKGIVSDWVLSVGRGHAHSQYFEMIASNGIWGLSSIVAIYLIPLVIFGRHYLKTDSTTAFTATVFVAGFMIYGLTEAPLQANLIGTFYGFILALFFSIVRVEKYSSASKEEKVQ
ncbi:O-antigen ligase family protein [Vibrio sp. TRT 1302]|uniref:O-antigen ligase family protein n=1 Tax=Vibrio sp. TRT 1302 TaxID=3418504 RepID=UPI003CECCFB1